VPLAILEIHAGGQFDLLDVDAEDFLAAVHIGQADGDLAVETTRAEQRGVEHVRAVGGGDDDDALLGVEAVHFDEQLVECLLAFVVTAAHAVAAVAADGVDFIDENQAGRVLFALFEHVADAGSADADKHFDEVRAGDREERHIRLAGDGAGEQGLAGAGGTDHQHALGDRAAEFLELARIAEEIDDFKQVLPWLPGCRRRP
jgi:hypothetical protein